MACELGNGGENSFAQEYADLTGKTVMAFKDPLWMDKKGGCYAAPYLPKKDPHNDKEPRRPDTSKKSYLIPFYPHKRDH